MHTVRSILSVGALPSGFSLAPSHNLCSLPAVCTAGCWAGIPMAMVFNDDALKVATLLRVRLLAPIAGITGALYL